MGERTKDRRTETGTTILVVPKKNCKFEFYLLSCYMKMGERLADTDKQPRPGRPGEITHPGERTQWQMAFCMEGRI